MSKARFLPALALLAALAPGSALAAVRTPRLQALMNRNPVRAQLVWVFFADRGAVPQARLGEARAQLTARATARRVQRAGRGVELADLPPMPEYGRGGREG